MTDQLKQLVYRLAEVTQEIADKQTEKKELQQQIASLMPSKRVELEGLPIIEKRWSSGSQEWKHDDLRREIVKVATTRRQANPETGAIEGETEAVVRELTECAQIGYWRRTALKERGIDPDEYVETKRGGSYTIQIHGEVAL